MNIIIKSQNEASTNVEDLNILPRVSNLCECYGKERLKHYLFVDGFLYSRNMCHHKGHGTLKKL